MRKSYMNNDSFKKMLRDKLYLPPRACPDAIASPRGWVNPRTNALVVPHRNLSYKLRLFKDKCRQMGVDYNSLEGIAPVKTEPKPEPVSAPVEIEEIIEIEESPVEEVAKEAEPEEAEEAENAEEAEPEVKKSDKKVEIKITPAAKKAAKKFGIDISTVEGTGKDGQITKNDIDKMIGV